MNTISKSNIIIDSDFLPNFDNETPEKQDDPSNLSLTNRLTNNTNIQLFVKNDSIIDWKSNGKKLDFDNFDEFIDECSRKDNQLTIDDKTNHLDCDINISNEIIILEDNQYSTTITKILPKQLYRPIHFDLMTINFLKYLSTISIGVIANSWVVWADQSDFDIVNGKCKKECESLIVKHSLAVDAAKEGTIIKIPKSLRIKEYPDFLNKSNKFSYKSKSIFS